MGPPHIAHAGAGVGGWLGLAAEWHIHQDPTWTDTVRHASIQQRYLCSLNSYTYNLFVWFSFFYSHNMSVRFFALHTLACLCSLAAHGRTPPGGPTRGTTPRGERRGAHASLTHHACGCALTRERAGGSDTTGPLCTQTHNIYAPHANVTSSNIHLGNIRVL